MRAFTEIEKRFIRRLVSMPADGVFSISQLLAQTLFTKRYRRALILQTEARFAVLYIHAEIFKDENLRKKETALFLDILSLIRYLRDQRYISLFIGTTTRLKPMYFWQDVVTYPVPKKDKVVLNDNGYYTAHPEFICDKNDRVVYQGILFDTDAYDMMAENLVGSVYISRALRELVQRNFRSKEDIRFEKLKRVLMGCIAVMSLFTISVVIAAFRYNVPERGVQEPINTEIIIHDTVSQYDEQIDHSDYNTISTLYGIDVSKYNGDVITEINAEDSLSFMICKATEGVTITDPDFLSNWQAMKTKGMIKGAYHFYRVNDDPRKQANHFWKTIQKIDSLDIAPIVDIEQGSIARSGVVDMMKLERELFQFLNYIETKSGRIPMIYTDLSFANTYLKHDVFARYPLWLAEYTSDDVPVVPHTWNKKGVRIWQKKDSYNIASHPTDFDVFFGSKTELYK
jgi:GH25 family lysozyme M1 (1,4-beta-N-acetylmuramidase)